MRRLVFKETQNEQCDDTRTSVFLQHLKDAAFHYSFLPIASRQKMLAKTPETSNSFQHLSK